VLLAWLSLPGPARAERAPAAAAEAVATRQVHSVAIEFPAMLRRVQVVAYRPTQTWVDVGARSAAITFQESSYPLPGTVHCGNDGATSAERGDRNGTHRRRAMQEREVRASGSLGARLLPRRSAGTAMAH
jgi:hypothetical protein